jgi:hypothetical protein
MTKEDELTAGLQAELARVNARLAQQEGRDWSLLEATQESLREHMAEIKRLKAAQPAPVQEPVGCMRCATPKKCAIWGCSPNTWPSENTTPPAAQPVPVKTYSGGKPWPVAPSNLNPEHIIRQLVTALEGSGTRLRTDQWYVEIEAVAAGKRYLAEMAMLGREKMDEEHRAGFDGPPED